MQLRGVAQGASAHFKTPGLLPPLGRVTHHFRPLAGPFSFVPSAVIPVSAASAYKTCLTRSHIRTAFRAGFSVAAPPFSSTPAA